MAVTKPLPVPEQQITSIDIVGWAAGWNLNGDQNAPINSFVDSKDVELDQNGFIIPRRTLSPFLPDTVETTYQKLPVRWNGTMYYITLDEGKAKYCQEGDPTWTDCGTPAVKATLTTALAGTNNDLLFTAVGYGVDGNAITIAYNNAGASQTLLVTVVGSAISVRLATNGSSVITSTANDVKAAILALPAAAALVTVANAAANDGTGLVTTLTATALTGGSGTNFFFTGLGGKPKFLRVLDKVLILNGTNGNKLAYIDLASAGFPVTKYALVTNPGSAPTAALTSITTGALTIYYAFSYSGAIGQTLLSPILTQTINVPRDQWQTMATPGKITLTRPGSPPAGAKYWNLFVALASTGGSITSSDMLELAVKIDLAQTTFVDDGSLDINLGSVAPTANSTDGPRVDQGIVEDGNPILFGDVDNSENIYIGGGGPYALDFSISNGGYLAQPEQGTNFEVTSIIGFRNGQGIPSLTVLFSNTEGLAKQSVLEQQTVTYGDQSFSVWGVTEQHYGAAGVSAPNSPINYNGKLLFLSTDGFMSMNTQALRQNVISTDPISIQSIDDYIRTIKSSAMKEVVGAGWNNKYMWTVPNNGFDTPQQILISDDNNQVNNKGAWYTLDIPAQWIGVVSPVTDPAFVYVCQGKKTFKLLNSTATYDTIDGVNVPFSTRATGPLVGMGGTARNTWQANVQAMFYVLGLVGDMTVGVTYRNQNGKLKTKTKVYHGPIFQPSGAGGWGDTGWAYGGFVSPGLDSHPEISTEAGTLANAVDVRIPVQIDDLMSEAQWFFTTPVGYSSYKMRAISFEGINLGVSPDLQ